MTDTTVECPVRGCGRTVERQQKTFRKEIRFRCPDHAIYISASTFEYEEASTNMLWVEPEDRVLWKRITQVGIKRESRIARDNSEDAVTWNVFRHLERQGLLERFIATASSRPSTGTPQLVYWSWCQQTCRAWQPLVEKALGFGETQERRSEPDLILEDDGILVFVENKLTSANRTVPTDPKNTKKYQTGLEGWFSTVFQPAATFESVAVGAKLYELMRLWLIGSRIAAEMGKRFVLVNVVRDGARSEADISDRFARYARLDRTRREFIRLTWESIRDLVVLSGPPNADRQRLLAYLRGKTLGYAGGQLRRAFGA